MAPLLLQQILVLPLQIKQNLMAAATMTSNTTTSAEEEQLYGDYTITWTKPIMEGRPPAARGGHTCVFDENKLVLFGGHFFGSDGKFTYLNDTHVLDLETSTWHEAKLRGRTLPAPRYNHSATLIGTRMFIFGGRGENGAVLKDMLFLDLEDWQWYAVHWTTDGPSARFDHAAVSVGSKLVIHAGWDGRKSKRDLWVFDTETFTWSEPETLGKLPTGRHGHVMSLLDDGRITLFGGYSVSSTSNNNNKTSGAGQIYNGDLYVLETETMVWSRPRVTGSYPAPRFGHTAVVSDDMMFLVGGWSGTQKHLINRGDKAMKQDIKARAREDRLESGYPATSDRRLLELQSTSDYMHILNTSSMNWETPPAMGLEVLNRYGHTCTLVGPHLFVFGGWDGSRAVNDLYVAELPVEEE